MDYRLDMVRKYSDEMQKKARKYYQLYQETGMASQERTYKKYEDLSDICTWAEKWIEEEAEDKMKRMRNVKAYCERLTQEKYTKEEVIEMLKDIAGW